jgi:hypothetical protein
MKVRQFNIEDCKKLEVITRKCKLHAGLILKINSINSQNDKRPRL